MMGNIKENIYKLVWNLSRMKLFFHIGRYIVMGARVFGKPEKHGIYFRQVIREMDKLGIGSLGIVAIISFFIVTKLTFLPSAASILFVISLKSWIKYKRNRLACLLRNLEWTLGNLADCRFEVLPEFAWMAGKIFGLARATCSAKYMIRANWSLVGGHRTELSPTQTKIFQVARGHTPVAQMSFASQVPLA